VLMKRRINSDVHVGVDAARKGEIVPPVEDLLGLLRRNIRREAFDFSVPNCDVQTIDRSLSRSYDADIFYDEIERFRHCHSSTVDPRRPLPTPRPLRSATLFSVALPQRQQFR